MKAIRRSTCASVFIFIAALQVLQAASIAVTPSNQSVALGSQAVLSIDISDLGTGEAPSIGAFDLNLTFDASVLALNSVVFGDPILGSQLDLFGFGSISASTPGIGVVNLFEVSLDFASDLNLLQADAFSLATLTFDTLAAGTSALGLTLNALGDADGLPLAASLTDGAIEVVDPTVGVPEPSSWVTYLLLLGTLGALIIARRKNCCAVSWPH